jgi:opacity protein-like surface antigen
MPDGTWEGTIDDIQIPQPTNYAGIGGITTIGAAIDAGTVVLALDAQFDFGGPVTIGNGSDLSYDLAKFCDLTEGDDPNCAVAGVSGTIDPLWRARAVIGTEIEPGFLVFATGGIATADVNLYTLFAHAALGGGEWVSNRWGLSGGPDGLYERMVGYTIGAGWKKRLGENFSLRGEVTHDNYGQFTTVPAGGSVSTFFGNAQASIAVLDYVTITNTAAQISGIWHVN